MQTSACFKLLSLRNLGKSNLVIQQEIIIWINNIHTKVIDWWIGMNICIMISFEIKIFYWSKFLLKLIFNLTFEEFY